MSKFISSKSFLMVLAIVISVTALFTGCGNKEGSDSTTTTANDSTPGASKLSGSIIVAGSTSVQPLAQELADIFGEMAKDIEIDIQAGGSTAGIEAVNNGVAQIGTASRELKEAEKAYGLTTHLIAVDGIAVIINPNNTVSDLTKEQIVKIYKGEIKNWKEVGGPDKDILVVQREASSGTKGAFEELLRLEKKDGDKIISLVRSDALVADSNGAVQTQVSTKENAIGYMSLGMVDATVKALKIDGVEAKVDNIKNKTYSLWRPFYMLTKGEMKPEVKAFIDYIKGDDGQEIAAKKYIKYTAVQ